MTEKQMLELAEKLKSMRDDKASLEADLKELNQEIADVEAQLVELMTTQEVSGFKHAGSTFSLVIREFPAAEPERKDELYDQMRKHGFENLFTINPMTLSGTVKELKANNDDTLPDWLEGLVKIAEKTGIRVSKSK
jgi:predicted nuclease with TOPRIM domain